MGNGKGIARHHLNRAAGKSAFGFGYGADFGRYGGKQKYLGKYAAVKILRLSHLWKHYVSGGKRGYQLLWNQFAAA